MGEAVKDINGEGGNATAVPRHLEEFVRRFKPAPVAEIIQVGAGNDPDDVANFTAGPPIRHLRPILFRMISFCDKEAQIVCCALRAASRAVIHVKPMTTIV